MTSCKHRKLVLLPEKKHKLRCKHCHLSIDTEELGDSYCPECFETKGRKLYDFQEIVSESKETIQYRCEECGILIESDQTN
jgi:rubrerythrin